MLILLLATQLLFVVVTGCIYLYLYEIVQHVRKSVDRLSPREFYPEERK